MDHFFNKLKNLDLSVGADHHLQPFDVVLFLGHDPVAKFIRTVQRTATVPSLKVPFNQLWTHAGILVDKSILPLPCLEDGKLYLYESIFSGEVLGYVYSKVLPVDHPTKPGGFHLGLVHAHFPVDAHLHSPQIRDFAAVIEEADSDVGIFTLTSESRKAVHKLISEKPNLMMDFYNRYKDVSYPLLPLKQIAAADDHLFSFRDTVLSHFPQFKAKDDGEAAKSVFCSELVALLLRELQLPSFVEIEASKFTPVELDVAAEFGNKCHYAKESGKVLIHSNNKVPVGGSVKFRTKLKGLFENMAQNHWLYVGPGEQVPANAVPAGNDENGNPLYVVRATIGGSVHPGEIERGADKARIGFEGAEMKIQFGHEVLVSLDGLQWVEASNGFIPPKAVLCGFNEAGKDIFIARARVDSGGFLGIGAKHALVPGKITEGADSSHICFKGKVLDVKTYEVLCFQ